MWNGFVESIKYYILKRRVCEVGKDDEIWEYVIFFVFLLVWNKSYIVGFCVILYKILLIFIFRYFFDGKFKGDNLNI